MLSSLITLFLLFFVLSFLIFVHELGHFVAAKICNIKVEEFALGMGPAIWSYKYGETTYRLNWFIFVGGYVSILGENDDPDKDNEPSDQDPRSFQNQNWFERFFVLIAGVTMNFFVAAIIYQGLFMHNDTELFPLRGVLSDYNPVFAERLEKEYIVYSLIDYDRSDVAEEKQSLVAKEGGVPEYGVITEVSTVDGESFDNIRDIQGFIDFTKSYEGEDLIYEFCNINEAFEADNCSEYTLKPNKNGLGISIGLVNLVDYSNTPTYLRGVYHSVNTTDMLARASYEVISDAIERGDKEDLANSVSSPIGIYAVIDEVTEESYWEILPLLAIVSLTLAFMNLLPIPALDGGRIVLETLKSLMGDRYRGDIEAMAVYISYIMLLGFMAVVLLKDIVYFIFLQRNPFN